MKTTYLTSLSASFNPFLPTSKIPRLVLSLLPAAAHRTIKIKSTQLPRSSTAPSTLELAFKDGKTLKYSWPIETVKLRDIIWEVDRHARVMARQEDLKG
ncbi:uncharacterized protein A1O9_04145 [Exophiala aquamarina CBS 119918]|uniref:Large ribosomal subunit protein mL53 n=1 Tax=Exophiala aquamarina CBS 119918 TaxID=1182545 RepID=A0A072PHJ1_9EURO|nr:uncharacterized protein A1O9_04145 [Exophiala aquamarina CBS 119918]KEF59301.1 hypothetical protein A1O9_04145 [Exophiala aquamarina CBS 119918]